MTKREIGTIARAAFPFFLLLVAMVLLLYAFPQIVTFLPEQMKGRVRRVELAMIDSRPTVFQWQDGTRRHGSRPPIREVAYSTSRQSNMEA